MHEFLGEIVDTMIKHPWLTLLAAVLVVATQVVLTVNGWGCWLAPMACTQ